jgi:four helix bundle protein
MGHAFRELNVWKKSIDLTVLVYELTREFPREETYGLTSQMRRASVSVASNIAEGSARGTRRDFRQFIKLAHSSNCELQTQLVISHRLGFGGEKEREQVESLSNEIGKMLGGLSAYLTDVIKSGQADN